MSHLGSSSNRQFGFSPLSRFLTPRMLALLIAVPFAILILWFATRPREIKKSSAASPVRNTPSLVADGSKPKPAPGKLLVPASAPAPLPPLPDWSHLTPANAQPAAPTQSMPNGMPTTVAPAPITGSVSPVPTSAARPPFTPIAYNARHDKAFGGGCEGRLTLNSAGLNFNCAEDPHASLQIAIGDINSVDENGVRLNSGKKFHFSITGMTKPGEQQLFSDWLNRTR